MGAFRKRLSSQRLLEQLQYWRAIRLDFPWRKTEAMRNIDNLLDEMLERNDGVEA